MSESEMSRKKTTDPLEAASDASLQTPLPDPGRRPLVRCLMQVLWPAFVGAGVTVGLLFSLIDPMDIDWVQSYLNDSRQASYTIGFLLLWLLYALTCSVTWYLATTETPHGRLGRRRRS